ncbi:MFS transporter [Patescibacteria group bacterium]|nr:MFS transporter [Patescibacteria group bacterium]MDE1946540.1 MFS transporter [Patescibacteria group bacterium]MDE2010899.1 MFS transporter [Patescibacteria group bacterium]
MKNLMGRFRELLPTKDLRRLVVVRGLRSLVQGYILVVFAIYLAQIGFSPWLIGLTLGIGSAVSALLTLTTGIASDRYGRKPFLLAYSVLLALSGIVFSFTSVPFVLIAVSALGGLGRGGGAGGQAGPFAPAEVALLSEKTTLDNRNMVFSINSAVGTFAMALGTLLAGLPEMIRSVYASPLIISYRPLFFGVTIVGIVTFFLLWPIKETVDRHKAGVHNSEKKLMSRKESVHMIWKISVAGMVNGFGIGFVGGILPYLLYLRFSVSPVIIGPVIGASSVLASFSSLWMAHMARRFGDIKVITASRVFGVICTALIPVMPGFGLAAVFVILRMAGAMGAMPVRQAYTMGIVDADLRGTTAGISGVARRIPSAVSPAISGIWISMGELELPFFASAAFMAMNAALYFYWFHSVKPKETTRIQDYPIFLGADS